jgi:Fic family protein
MLADVRCRVQTKKAEFDRLRPLAPGVLEDHEHVCDLELTYTTNAIEGNSLTHDETALVIERGLVIGGKRLRDHLEAIDNYDALAYAREVAAREEEFTKSVIRRLHALTMRRSRPDIAGRYADNGRQVHWSAERRTLPPPAEVPALMQDLSVWLRAVPPTPETAFAAHLRLLDVHPFNEGNGRAARLLMNLILLRGGYPAVSIRPDDRFAYLEGLWEPRVEHGDDEFEELLYQRLEATLDGYVNTLAAATPGRPSAGVDLKPDNIADTNRRMPSPRPRSSSREHRQ